MDLDQIKTGPISFTINLKVKQKRKVYGFRFDSGNIDDFCNNIRRAIEAFYIRRTKFLEQQLSRSPISMCITGNNKKLRPKKRKTKHKNKKSHIWDLFSFFSRLFGS